VRTQRDDVRIVVKLPNDRHEAEATTGVRKDERLKRAAQDPTCAA